MTAHDDAEKAVAEALQANWNLWPADALRMAQDAVAAAAPILLPAERTRIAAAVRAEAEPYPPSAWVDGLRLAARIAETAPEEPTDA